MKELCFGLLPGSIFIYRYAPTLEAGKLLGFALMELMPFVAVCMFEHAHPATVAIGFLLLYSVYEIGYLHNDRVAIKESAGKTERTQFSRFRLGLFLAARIPVIAALAAFSWTVYPAYPFAAIGLIAALFVIFLVHNTVLDPHARITTFIALNGLKIVVRLLFISPAAGYYLLAAVPHLMIKLIHYLHAKELVQVEAEKIRSMSLPLYAGFSICLLAIDWKLCVVCLPYLLNHCKAVLYFGFRSLLSKRRTQ